MATERNIKVDPAVVGGDGDGSEWIHAYASLSLAEADQQGDISVTTGSDEYVVFECRSSGANPADDTAVSFIGWTTEAGNYIEVKATSGHEALKTGWSTLT
jgi:hypothetical protein